jgi:hypothetical protein
MLPPHCGNDRQWQLARPPGRRILILLHVRPRGRGRPYVNQHILHVSHTSLLCISATPMKELRLGSLERIECMHYMVHIWHPYGQTRL